VSDYSKLHDLASHSQPDNYAQHICAIDFISYHQFQNSTGQHLLVWH